MDQFKKILAIALLVVGAVSAQAQRPTPPPAQNGPQWLNADSSKKVNQSNFRGMEQWPTPNEYRSGSGAPGPKYWQQKVDYVMRAALDTVRHEITGHERIKIRGLFKRVFPGNKMKPII